jgi:hypothetical protein
MPLNAAKFAGLDASGEPMFDIVVSIPDGVGPDAPCTERQLEAVQEFYCTAFSDGLTYSQAHKLLSYRQYAKGCASHILRGAHPKMILLYARAIAAFISSEPEIATYAVSRSETRFHFGTEAERVSRTKYFSDVLAFFENLSAQCPRRIDP